MGHNFIIVIVLSSDCLRRPQLIYLKEGRGNFVDFVGGHCCWQEKIKVVFLSRSERCGLFTTAA